MQHRSLVFVAAIASLASMGLATATLAADAPAPAAAPSSSPSKDCKPLSGDARKECESVAAKMKQSQRASDGPSANKAVGVHSSPIMIDDKERAIAEAKRKGQDPRKAVEKIEAKERAPAPRQP